MESSGEMYDCSIPTETSDAAEHTQKTEKDIVIETARHFLPGVEIITGEDDEIIIR